MADLDSLIRLRKHTVDQKQKYLAGLYREAEELEQQKQSLRDQLARERELVEQQEILEALSYYGHFANGVRTQIASLDHELEVMEQRINAAREELREAFSEMKKIEITARRRAEEASRAEQKKEDQELDEIAIDGYRRKKDQT